MGRWLLGLVLAGVALGIVENRTGFLRKGYARASEKLPKDRLAKVLHLQQARQPWWKIG